MIVTVLFILAVAALIATIVALMGKCPLWVAVILLSIWACLSSGMPLGR